MAATNREQALPTTPAGSFDSRSRVLLGCELALLALLAWDVVRAGAAIWRHAALPFQIDYEEGNILNALLRITHGLTPYPDPHAFPNILNPYGPVAYYLLAVPVKLLGVFFLWPRLVIVACMVAICVFLGLTITRLTRSVLAGVVFGAMYATLPVVEAWSALLRVDFLALALSAAGVYVFCRGARVGFATEDTEKNQLDQLANAGRAAGTLEPGNHQSRIGDLLFGSSSVASVANRSLIVSVALFVTSLFVKPTFVAAPMACTLYLVTRRRWRQVAGFVGFAAGVSAAAFAVTQWLTHGFFAQHLFLTHPDPFSWNAYALRISRLAIAAAPLLALAAVRIVWELRQKQFSVASWWLLLATITAITAGKQGSGWNHFLEWTAAVCVCAGMGWGVVGKSWRPAAVLFTAWLAAMLVWPAQPIFDWSNGLQQCPQAYAYVRQHGGDRVLSENVGALVLAGKTVWVSNPFVYSQMVIHGTQRDDAIEPRLRSRWFDMVVTRRDYTQSPEALQRGAERFSAGMLQGLAANYRVVRTFQCTDANVVLEPLPLQSK